MKKLELVFYGLLILVIPLVLFLGFKIITGDSKDIRETTHIDMTRIAVPKSNVSFEDLPDYNPSEKEETPAENKNDLVAGEKQSVEQEKDDSGADFYRVVIDKQAIEDIKKKNDEAEVQQLKELEELQKQIDAEYNFEEEANEEKFCAVYHLENKMDENGVGADVFGRGFVTYPFYISGQKTIEQSKDSVPKVQLNKMYDLVATKYYLYSPSEEKFHEVEASDSMPSNSCVIVSYQVNLKN